MTMGCHFCDQPLPDVGALNCPHWENDQWTRIMLHAECVGHLVSAPKSPRRKRQRIMYGDYATMAAITKTRIGQ